MEESLHGESTGMYYILGIALSVHSLFEGLAVGLYTEKSKVISIGLGITIHKIPASIALGISLIDLPRTKAMFVVLVFALASPIGISIGIGLNEFKADALVGIALSVSAGTFVFIAASSIIVEEFEFEEKRYAKFFGFCIGVGIFTAIRATLVG